MQCNAIAKKNENEKQKNKKIQRNFIYLSIVIMPNKTKEKNKKVMNMKFNIPFAFQALYNLL